MGFIKTSLQKCLQYLLCAGTNLETIALRSHNFRSWLCVRFVKHYFIAQLNSFSFSIHRFSCCKTSSVDTRAVPAPVEASPVKPAEVDDISTQASETKEPEVKETVEAKEETAEDSAGFMDCCTFMGTQV